MTERAQVAVRRVSPLDDPKWDSSIACDADATFFHTSAWARVLHDTYGFKLIYLQAGRDRAERSVLPLMEVDSWLTGRRGVSLPFTDECCPLGAKDQVAALTDAAISCAQRRRWRYLEFRHGGFSTGQAPVSSRYYGHTLDLHQDLTHIFAHCDSSLRRAVRKAAASDIQIEFRQNLDALGQFYRLLCRTRQRHGVPPQPMQFFDQLHRHVFAKNQGWVVLATLRDRPIAGAVFVHAGRTAIYKYGASDDSFQELRPNNLVMWRAIEWYARAGYSSMDFGRTALENEGLRRFKLGWGTRERVLNYVRVNRCTADLTNVAPEKSGWQQRVFKTFPKPLLRLIGAVAYRHVA